MNIMQRKFLIFTHDGLPCKIVKNSIIGVPVRRRLGCVDGRVHTSWAPLATGVSSVQYYCGYVGIEKGHALYEVSYDDYDDMRNLNVFGGPTYAAMEEHNIWWIGFDTYHPMSGSIKEWSEEEAIEETKNLAEQLKQWNIKQLLL